MQVHRHRSRHFPSQRSPGSSPSCFPVASNRQNTQHTASTRAHQTHRSHRPAAVCVRGERWGDLTPTSLLSPEFPGGSVGLSNETSRDAELISDNSIPAHVCHKFLHISGCWVVECSLLSLDSWTHSRSWRRRRQHAYVARRCLGLHRFGD